MIKQCYVSEKLEEELKQWYTLFNNLSKKNTQYIIRPGNPTASEICAAILSAVRNNINEMNIELKDNNSRRQTELSITGEIKIHLNLNVEFNKIKGVKKNDILFQE